MSAPGLVLPDTRNKYEDLTGIESRPGDNPYEALIAACDDDPAKVQALYATHRTRRNAQQRAKFLDPAFQEVLVDPYLLRIENPRVDPSFSDPRHGLVFWARPPEHVLQLAAHVQGLLRDAAPHIWLMPLHRMHMTALEITHSRTPEEAFAVVDTMARAVVGDAGGSAPTTGMAAVANYTYGHRARLVKPMVSYDLAAVALSFVPAAGEPRASPPPVPPASAGDGSDCYTYHHLRRDLFACAAATGVDIASRYVVPSAHITLARFLSQDDHATPAARQAWVDALDAINAWLQKDVWDKVWEAPGEAPGGSGGSPLRYRKPDLPPPHRRLVGEWVVGQERGLDARTGALWYGGGRSVMVGQGF